MNKNNFSTELIDAKITCKNNVKRKMNKNNFSTELIDALLNKNMSSF